MMKKKIFLLRGLMRESGHWLEFKNLCQERFSDYSIHCLDLPGFGTKAHLSSPCSIENITEIIRAQYLQLNSEKTESILFAISLGGMVAFDWLYRYPDDFSHAFICNSSMRGFNPFYQRFLPRNYFKLFLLPFLPLQIKEKWILSMVSNNEEMQRIALPHWIEIQKKRPASFFQAIKQLIAAIRYKGLQEKPKTNINLLCSENDRLVSSQCSKTLAHAWGFPIFFHPSAGHEITLDDSNWVIEKIIEVLMKS